MLLMRDYKVTGTNYTPEPYEPATYVIGLHAICSWYDRMVGAKGVQSIENNRDLIFSMIVDKIFGDEDYDDDKVNLFLNLDCVPSREWVIVKTKLETQILNKVLGHFPKIGAVLPKNLYLLKGKDLLIDVPLHYDDQRGYFI